MCPTGPSHDYKGTALPAVGVSCNGAGWWASGNLENVLPNPQTRQLAFAGLFSDEFIPCGPTVHQALGEGTLEMLSHSAPWGSQSRACLRVAWEGLVRCMCVPEGGRAHAKVWRWGDTRGVFGGAVNSPLSLRWSVWGSQSSFGQIFICIASVLC